MKDDGFVRLADAVAELRSQLADAQHVAENSELRFGVENIEVEFALEIKKIGGGDGKLQLGVVTIGASGSISSAHTHKVKFVLHPTDSTQQDINIRGRLDVPPGQ
jgi:Trypsin-co-occurring domain 2